MPRRPPLWIFCSSSFRGGREPDRVRVAAMICTAIIVAILLYLKH